MNSVKTILLVDDSDFDRKLICKALTQKSEHCILEATTAEECFAFLETHKIDLILLDILMPNTIGTEILKSIRDKFNAVELPVIMVTAKTETEDVVGSLHLGANDYITKPINFDIAISRIETHLNLSTLHDKTVKLQRIGEAYKLVSTLNHEINNGLTIAMAHIKRVLGGRDVEVSGKKVDDALTKIAGSTRKISETLNVQLQELSQLSDQNSVNKILNLKKIGSE